AGVAAARVDEQLDVAPEPGLAPVGRLLVAPQRDAQRARAAGRREALDRAGVEEQRQRPPALGAEVDLHLVGAGFEERQVGEQRLRRRLLRRRRAGGEQPDAGECQRAGDHGASGARASAVPPHESITSTSRSSTPFGPARRWPSTKPPPSGSSARPVGSPQRASASGSSSADAAAGSALGPLRTPVPSRSGSGWAAAYGPSAKIRRASCGERV